ncbi:hypothetical protein GQ42DRAFT_118094, partial [Ramicandelaber brevisporus]
MESGDYYSNSHSHSTHSQHHARGARPLPAVPRRPQQPPRLTAAAGKNAKNAKLGKKGKKGDEPEPRKGCDRAWMIFSRVITFWMPNAVLKCYGLESPDVQQAWREKMALVTIILCLFAIVGFMSFGLQEALCLTGKSAPIRMHYKDLGLGQVAINGLIYELWKYKHPGRFRNLYDPNPNFIDVSKMDLSLLFQYPNGRCKGVLNYDALSPDSHGNVLSIYPCYPLSMDGKTQELLNAGQDEYCHFKTGFKGLSINVTYVGEQYFTWDDIKKNKYYKVYNGVVLDMRRLQYLRQGVGSPQRLQAIQSSSAPFEASDITLRLLKEDKQLGQCLTEIARAGVIDSLSIGCMGANIVLYVSLVVILAVVLAKFGLAIFFAWIMGPRLGRVREESPEERKKRIAAIEKWSDVNNHYDSKGRPGFGKSSKITKNNKRGHLSAILENRMSSEDPEKPSFMPRVSVDSSFRVVANDASTGLSAPQPAASRTLTTAQLQQQYRMSTMAPHFNALISSTPAGGDDGTPDGRESPAQNLLVSPYDFRLAHTILMVTCYSEGMQGIRSTLDSLAASDYPDSHKMLFVICDGVITGAGESMSTPASCLSMMTDFVIPPERVRAYSYVAVADGQKRHNMAKVYAGFYQPDEFSPEAARTSRTPMILVVKCGPKAERRDRKPGNRGKRDSQIVLMSFLQRAIFDDRMTELEYELFNAIWAITGVTPDTFELLLMVDADTKVFPDALTRMVAAMVQDNRVMGLCGETKIANKRDSWVTMIQVFEYYFAHHQAKAFESVFGGVTCLPGCFSMYRIKAPKGDKGYFVPILASPDIIENYSENIVDTLHKKNLLLLGEDRYLTTLMLRTFPKRKMIFVPSAVCKTIVPDTFRVLLSQRRRWINSTVHNLLELVLIRDLCGTFCFSMQFLIFMDLIGTLVLPAAIVFTLYVIIRATFTRPVPWLPLVLLAVVLGLPAVLIGLTTRKIVYVGWMFIYLLSLPIWNFVLPVYAYWHFDDFTWGQTRQVKGEQKQGDHSGKEGEFDPTQITMKKWSEFEADKR